MSASPLLSTPARAVRRMAGEIAKFGIVGVVGVVVNLAAFAVLQDAMATGRANALSTALSILTNYIGYRYWVYRDADRNTRSREIGLFLVFSAIGAVIQVGVVYAATYWVGFDTKLEKMFAAVVGIGIATVFRFICYRTWVFRVVPGAAGNPAGEGLAEADADADGAAAVAAAEQLLAGAAEAHDPADPQTLVLRRPTL